MGSAVRSRHCPATVMEDENSITTVLKPYREKESSDQLSSKPEKAVDGKVNE